MITKLLKKLNLSTVFVILIIGANSFTEIAAQIHNAGTLRVVGGSLYLHSGEFSFGATSVTGTTRSTPFNALDGTILLGPSASFATDGAPQKFVNGHAGTFNTSSTLLAIGGSGGTVYAPIKVQANTNINGVQACYFRSAPLTPFNGGLAANVNNVANTEYWIVKGDNAIVSLSWRSASNLNVFTTSLVGVSIVGYNTTNSKWELIDSTPEPGSTLTSGYIKSNSAINLSNYSALAIGEKAVSCFPAITASGNTRTWNGTSWDVVPTLADAAILNGNYNGTGFQCNSLNLGTYNAILNSGTVEVVNDILGTGKIILSGTASLVQQSSTAAKPQIELTRTTRPIKRFDYVYWGSPVVENNFTQLSTNAIASGQSISGAFDDKYKYVSGVTGTSGGWQPLSTTEAGKGFIMRVKEQAPFINSTVSATINLKFTGTANNGNIQVPVAKVVGNDTSARNNNLLANPYPSPIDAEKFLTENNHLIDGVIYLWRANTVNSGAAGATYSNADYVAYTKAGTTSSNVGNAVVFDGAIATGQGFKVKALASGNVMFTNCMRIPSSSSNGQFLRSNSFASTNNEQKDRFKLNIQSTDGIENQILIAYLPQSTLEYDNMYDASLLSVGAINIYSILDDTNKKLAINSRPNFNIADQVKIGFSKNDSTSSSLKINVVDKEGVFADNQTSIYIYDSLLNTYHNFINGPYTFTTNDVENTSRFKIVYEASKQANNDITNAYTSIYLNENKLKVESSKDIKQILIYDLTGRLVKSISGNNQKTIVQDFNYAEAIYIAKVISSDDTITTQKLINK